MKIVLPLFTIAYGAVAGLFGIAGLVLMGFAFLELWTAVIEPEGQTLPARAAAAIESIGLIAVALVALEMCKPWRRKRSSDGSMSVHPRGSVDISRGFSSSWSWLSGLRALSRSCRHSTSGQRRSRTPQASPSARQPSWQRGVCSFG